MKHRLLPLLLLLIVAPTLAGCLRVKESFPDHDRSTVWTAIKTVAEEPTYQEWHLLENRVWADPDSARLEIYRVARRTLHRPQARPLNERREWRFQVTLDEKDPPTATFLSRGWAVPMHARIEADRFFDDVWEVLGGRPVPDPRLDPEYVHPDFREITSEVEDEAPPATREARPREFDPIMSDEDR